MPKISIITPIWCDTSHKVDWLAEMIESVQSQTLTDWEIILINDKSPLSLDPVKMKFAGDERLRWFDNAQNSGPAMTRNTAVALGRAECILPLDADDLLASTETLEYMHDAWIVDNTKTVYGNVQLYRPGENGTFERSKVYQLAHYSFEGAMNLNFGIMPVTTMHSKDAHYKAGGWKPILVHGREDLEYWISTGKNGFCGQKIDHTTLLYRKHEESRDYKLKFENNQLEAVQQQIKEMHSDIYAGRFPMACCGKGKASAAPVSDPIAMSRAAQGVTRITALDGYEEKDLEWVAYQGNKKGRFDILTRGPAGLPSAYTILGTGHYFQIHKAHRKLFADRQRLHFQMNQPDPREEKQPETLAPPEPQVVEIPPPAPPEMSTIERPDRIVVESQLDIIETTVINPTANLQISTDWKIADLELSSRITEILKSNGYIFSDLLSITPKELALLPGIGEITAKKIITKVQELIKQG